MDATLTIKEGYALDTGLIDQADSWEEFISWGQEIRHQKDTTQWLLGYLAFRVETKYGEQSLEKYAKEIGVVYRTLLVYRWVVKKYISDNPSFQPLPKLPFSLYQAIADVPKEDREKLLQQAHDGDFSVEKVRFLARHPSEVEEDIMGQLKEIADFCASLVVAVQQGNEGAKRKVPYVYRAIKRFKT